MKNAGQRVPAALTTRLLLLWLPLVWSTAPAAPETYDLPVTTRPPVIDGRIDDACWREALLLDRFVKLGTGEPLSDPRAATRAHVIADAENLYFAIHCGEPHMTRLIAAHTAHDSPVWKDDDVEIMIVPCEGSGDRYVQLAVNAAGAVMDAFFPGARAPMVLRYDSGAEARTRRAEQAWSVELRLPLARLPVESVQGPWRFHIARARRTESAYLTCLRTPVSGFHELPAYAQLAGIGRLGLRAGLADVSLGPLAYGANSCSLRLTGDRASVTGISIHVDAELRAVFDQAALQIMGEDVSLPFLLNEGDRGRTLALTAFCGERPVQTRLLAGLDGLPLSLIGEPSQSVYFQAPGRAASIDVPVHARGNDARPLQLRWAVVSGEGNEVASGLTTPAGDARLRLFWEPWSPGTYVLQCELWQEERPVATRPLEIRLVASPWNELE